MEKMSKEKLHLVIELTKGAYIYFREGRLLPFYRAEKALKEYNKK